MKHRMDLLYVVLFMNCNTYMYNILYMSNKADARLNIVLQTGLSAAIAWYITCIGCIQYSTNAMLIYFEFEKSY